MAKNCHEALCVWAGCDHPPHCMSNSITEDSAGKTQIYCCVLVPNHPPPCAFGNPSLVCPRCKLVSPAAAHAQLRAAVEAITGAKLGDVILCLFCSTLACFDEAAGGDLRMLTRQEMRAIPVEVGKVIYALSFARARALLATLGGGFG